MNASEVIESYVRDVAACLPRGKRNDVAFELRSLLADELAAKARAEGREPDKAMAMGLLKGFGRPAEAAARYHHRPALIEAADTHHFLIWALAGAVVLSVRTAMVPGRPVDDSERFLQWLGALVIVFAVMGWWRRRNPGAMRWKPNRGLDSMSRGVAVFSTLATLAFPVFMYAAPQTFVRIMFLGALPTNGVALDPDFAVSPMRIATVVAFGVYTALYFLLVVDGRYRRWTHLAFAAAMLAIGLLLGSHGSLAGQNLVFVSAHANATAAPIFASVGAFMVLCAFYEMYREWARISPAPALTAARA